MDSVTIHYKFNHNNNNYSNSSCSSSKRSILIVIISSSICPGTPWCGADPSSVSNLEVSHLGANCSLKWFAANMLEKRNLDKLIEKQESE